MTGRIDALMEHARDRISAWLPDLRHCGTHDGRVDGREVGRIAKRTPAVLVGLLEASDVEADRFPVPPDAQGLGGEPGSAVAALRLSAFVLCRDVDRSTSGWKRARAICERIAVGIATDPWQVGFPREMPSEIRIASLYSSGQDRTGVALMAVAWQQRIELVEPDAAGPDRPLPRELYRGLEPETGAAHADDYDRLAPEEAAE